MRNYRCPHCHRIVTNAPLPPQCWGCGAQLGYADALCNHPMAEELAAKAAAEETQGEPQVRALCVCRTCDAECIVWKEPMPERCPACHGHWDEVIFNPHYDRVFGWGRSAREEDFPEGF